MAQVMFFLVSSLLFFRQITLLRMAAKALKDLKNLPVSERNIDCKKNPCAGKMNGKAEDRPPQNSVPLDHNHPTGDEIEKPEAERVIVELEYIKSKDLNNVAEVDAVLKSLDRSSSFHFPQGRNAAFAGESDPVCREIIEEPKKCCK